MRDTSFYVCSDRLIHQLVSEAFRSLLPPHYEFTFIDGEVPMGTYAEIADFFPGPYFCYHDVNTMSTIKDVCDYILEVIEEEG